MGGFKMNVAIISSGLYPCSIGGAEIFNYYFINEISKYNKVRVITTCNKKQAIDHQNILKKIKPLKFTIPLQIFYYNMKHTNRLY